MLNNFYEFNNKDKGFYYLTYDDKYEFHIINIDNMIYDIHYLIKIVVTY